MDTPATDNAPSLILELDAQLEALSTVITREGWKDSNLNLLLNLKDLLQDIRPHLEQSPSDDALLQELWKSSRDLLARFEARPSVKQALAKVNEESDEFKKALYESDDAGEWADFFARRSNALAEEGADFFATIINAAALPGLTYAQFVSAIRSTIRKNNGKTLKDYMLDERTQSIVRRS